MHELLKIFSTRELAYIIWLFIGVISIFSIKKIRSGIYGIVKSFFARKIYLVLLFYLMNVLIIVLILYNLKLWEIIFLKETIFWTFNFIIMMFSKLLKRNPENIVKIVFQQTIRLSILLGFLYNIFTFDLMTEIIMFPIIFFLVVIYSFSNTDKQNAPKKKPMTNLFALLGVTYLAFTIYKTIVNYQMVFTFDKLQLLILPIVLSILILPCCYLIVLYAQYDLLLTKIILINLDPIIQAEVIKNSILTAKLNINKVVNIKKNMNKFYLSQAKNQRDYIKKIASSDLIKT
ncbi:MAG: hypothetical protein WCR42_09135 [bacterium]